MATVVAVVSTLTWQLVTRRPWYKLLTNVALPTAAVVARSTAFVLVGFRDVPHVVLGTSLLLVIYFIADTVPLTLLLGIAGQPAVSGRLRHRTRWGSPAQPSRGQLALSARPGIREHWPIHWLEPAVD